MIYREWCAPGISSTTDLVHIHSLSGFNMCHKIKSPNLSVHNTVMLLGFWYSESLGLAPGHLGGSQMQIGESSFKSLKILNVSVACHPELSGCITTLTVCNIPWGQLSIKVLQGPWPTLVLSANHRLLARAPTGILTKAPLSFHWIA